MHVAYCREGTARNLGITHVCLKIHHERCIIAGHPYRVRFAFVQVGACDPAHEVVLGAAALVRTCVPSGYQLSSAQEMRRWIHM